MLVPLIPFSTTTGTKAHQGVGAEENSGLTILDRDELYSHDRIGKE